MFKKLCWVGFLALVTASTLFASIWLDPPPDSALASAPPASTDCIPTWERVPSPNPETGSAFLADVSIGSANDIWAVGSWGLGNYYGTLIEHWDGAEWSIVPSPYIPENSSALSAVVALAPDDAWAVGSNGSWYSTIPLILHWDGTLWSRVDTPPQSFGTLVSISAVAPDDIWAVGGNVNGPHILHWDGKTWQEKPVPTYARLIRVVTRAADDVWVLGQDRETVVILHWNGSVWSVHSMFNPDGTPVISDMAVIDPNNIWVIGTEIHNEFVTIINAKSYHWDGSQWTFVEPAPPGERIILQQLVRFGTDKIMALAYWESISFLTWDQDHWSRYRLSEPYTNSAAGSIAAVSENEFWLVGSSARYWGETMILHGTLPCKLVPPNPQPISPANDAVLNEVRPTFTWEPATGADWYRIVAGPITATTKETAFSLFNALPDGSFTWQVAACNYAGCSSDSEERTFHIQAAPIVSPPTLLEPQGGDVVSNDQVRLIWRDDRAQSYTLEIRLHSRRGTLLDSRPLDNPFWQPQLPSELYFWRVNSCTNGTCGPWSSWHRFWVMASDAPRPQPLQPRANQSLATHRPRFRWAKHVVATSYKLKLNRDSTRGPLVGIAKIGNTTEWRWQQRLAAGRYSWQLAACVQEICSAWSEALSFEISDPPHAR